MARIKGGLQGPGTSRRHHAELRLPRVRTVRRVGRTLLPLFRARRKGRRHHRIRQAVIAVVRLVQNVFFKAILPGFDREVVRAGRESRVEK